jgi:hypothetical protein
LGIRIFNFLSSQSEEPAARSISGLKRCKPSIEKDRDVKQEIMILRKNIS